MDDKFALILDGDALAAPQGRAEDILIAATYKLSDGLGIRAGYQILKDGADNDEVYNFALFHYALLCITFTFLSKKSTNKMNEQLKTILPDNRIDELLSIGKEKSIAASDHFIKAGETPLKIAYVSKGLFRYVYTNSKGDEFTKGIILENFFLSSYSAMILRKPSYFSIEALENSQVIEITWKDFTQLLDNDIFWVKFLLKFVEKGFMIKEKRERDLLLLDAETRYKNFLEEFPGMDQRIKQGIIASYLGIQPETLSRIRKKIIF